MATTYTENYNLGMQKDHSDKFDMDVITDNMEKIDEALAGKQDTLTPTQLAAINSGIDSTKVEQIETNKNNISTDEAALVELVDGGAKNLLNILTPTTINRMSIMDAGSGSVTASCSNVTWANSGYNFSLTAGKTYKFIIYVDSANVSDVQFQCFVSDISGSTAQEIARTSRITSPRVYSVDFVATSKIRASINLNNSSTAATGSATYHAMLCTKAAWDISQTYQPYRKDLAELTVDSDEDRASLVELVDGGAKNLYQFTWGSTTTHGGITFTNNLDGSWTLNGTSTFDFAHVDTYNAAIEPIGKPGDKLVCSLEEYISGLQIYIRFYDANGSQINPATYITNEAKEIVIPSNAVRMLYRIDVLATGTKFENVIVKPMICTKAAWDISKTYQPYRPSYQELYERVVALEQANQ